jgi:hypothetical protein
MQVGEGPDFNFHCSTGMEYSGNQQRCIGLLRWWEMPSGLLDLQMKQRDLSSSVSE